MSEKTTDDLNNKEEMSPFVVLHPMSIILNNVLIKYSTTQFEKISSEDLSESKINLELNQNTYVKMDLNEDTEKFFNTASIIAAGTSIPSTKEVMIFPNNVGIISFRVFYKLMEIHQKETNNEAIKIDDFIQKKELVEITKTEKVIELLKSKPIIVQITDELFVILGKMRKITWDILSSESNVVTTMRLYAEPQDMIPGYTVLTSQTLNLIKDMVDNSGIVELEKDFAELLKPEGE